MGRPEITRSGNVSIGANTPRESVTTPTIISEESFGPVPDDNQPGHHPPDEDPDKPYAKFAARFGTNRRPARRGRSRAAGEPMTRSDLYEEAKQKGLRGRSKMNRDELSHALGYE
jgi:hypothetical protein